MFTISKWFTFEAAHHLIAVGPEHPCSRPHGHSYTVTLMLAVERLDDKGMVVDYNQLGVFKDWLDEHLDHRDLNVVLGPSRAEGAGPDLAIGETTAENLARWLFRFVRRQYDWGVYVTQVIVSETAKTTACYSED